MSIKDNILQFIEGDSKNFMKIKHNIKKYKKINTDNIDNIDNIYNIDVDIHVNSSKRKLNDEYDLEHDLDNCKYKKIKFNDKIYDNFDDKLHESIENIIIPYEIMSSSDYIDLGLKQIRDEVSSKNSFKIISENRPESRNQSRSGSRNRSHSRNGSGSRNQSRNGSRNGSRSSLSYYSSKKCSKICLHLEYCKKPDTCNFAHKFEELGICKYGIECKQDKCMFMFHSYEQLDLLDDMLKIGRKTFELCPTYYREKYCNNIHCLLIHYNSTDNGKQNFDF